MREQGSNNSNKAATPWTYTSTVGADFTAKIIIRGAGILTLGSLLMGFLLPSSSSFTGLDAVWLSLAIIGSAMLILLGPRALRTTAKVRADEVLLSTMGIKARIDPQAIKEVTNSNFPSGGYGYRNLGKMHRGFISGGAQADIKVMDGREYTVSVESVGDFCAAVAAAKTTS